jgi:hypothetical protein
MHPNLAGTWIGVDKTEMIGLPPTPEVFPFLTRPNPEKFSVALVVSTTLRRPVLKTVTVPDTSPAGDFGGATWVPAGIAPMAPTTAEADNALPARNPK